MIHRLKFETQNSKTYRRKQEKLFATFGKDR